jgi:hypothetical protein
MVCCTTHTNIYYYLGTKEHHNSKRRGGMAQPHTSTHFYIAETTCAQSKTNKQTNIALKLGKG